MKLEQLHLYLTLIREDIAKLELRLEGVQRLAAQLTADGGDNGMLVSGLKDNVASISEDVSVLCDLIDMNN